MSTRASHKTSRNKAPTQVDQGMEPWLTLTSIDRAIFTWVSKEIYVYLGFALLRSVIGLKNLRHFLDQTEVKPKPIPSKTKTMQSWLARARFPVLKKLFRVLIGQWIALYPLWLVSVISLVLVLRHSIENCSIFNIGRPCYGWLTAVKTMFLLISFLLLKKTIFAHRTEQNKSKNVLATSDLSLLCLFILQLIYYRSSFGIVLSGNSTRLQHCFLDYLVEKRSLLTQLVKNYTKTLPVSKTSTTRDADSFLVWTPNRFFPFVQRSFPRILE